jgi:tetratricopeptide (TPR) repeat protein
MAGDPLLNKALNLSKRGKYDQSIKMLESEVFRYQESFPYYHILGLSCLYVGDFGGAFTYFNRAKNIKFRETGPLLGLGLYFLKRGDTDRAVDLYLDVQDIDPANKTAKKALAVIRKYSSPEELSTWIEQGKARSLYPPFPGGAFNFRPLLFVLLALVCAGIIAGTVYYFIQGKVNSGRNGFIATELSSEEKSLPAETGGSYRYLMKQNEAAELYAQARKDFNGYHDEKAKYNINKILESNAPAAIKNKARLMLSYTEEPRFDTIKDRFTYAEVAAEPYFYKDCYVLWKGMPSEPAVNQNEASFALLVGYHNNHNLEGAVPVTLNFAEEINTNWPIEVLGKVELLSGGQKFMLRAQAIHQSPGQ